MFFFTLSGCLLFENGQIDIANCDAIEICDGIDNDCDGSLDSREIDYDGDGFVSCEITADWIGDANIIGGSDCDDDNAEIHPEASEICDGIDNDCDLLVDDADEDWDSRSGGIWYADLDEDGFGDPESPIIACTQPANSSDDNSDCNDDDALINPSAEEDFSNEVDEDCDGLIYNERPMSLVQAGDLLISEIMRDTGGGFRQDWFEIYNNSDVDIDLTGLVVHYQSDSTGEGFTVLAGSSRTSNVIAAGGFFVFADDTDTDINGGLSTVHYTETPAFGTSGRLELRYEDSLITKVDFPERYPDNGWGFDTFRGKSISFDLEQALQQNTIIDNSNMDLWCHEWDYNYALNSNNTGTPGLMNSSCDPDEDGYWAFEDCNDSNFNAHPYAIENILNSTDENCDQFENFGFTTCESHLVTYGDGSEWYYLSCPEEVSFIIAQTLCASTSLPSGYYYGGLTSIENDIQNQMVSSFIFSPAWIGYNNINGTWQWDDGSTTSYVAPSFAFSGYYAYIKRQGIWESTNSAMETHSFICAKKL